MRSRIMSLMAAMALALSTLAASIETDRTWYLAGEAMTVSVTAADALIAYAELCDTRGLAAGAVVSLEAGEGSAVIELPSSLHSGYYVLSAYTRHDVQVAHRLVAVVNPLRKSVDDDVEWVMGDSCWVMGDSCWVLGDGTADLVDRKEAGEPEVEGHIVKARVGNAYAGQVFSGSQILPSLSIIGKQIHYFEGKMVGDSLAVFYTYGIHGQLPMVLSAVSSTGISLPIELVSPFATLLPKRLPHLVFHYQRSEVEARSLDMQRRQLAMSAAAGQTGGQQADVSLPYDETLFGTRPDQTYNLDEYRQFLTVREVLLEYVNFVVKRKVNGTTRLFARREMDHINTTLPTLVLIDGMPVYDTEQLLSYDARRVHYINIYGGQYTFGHGLYEGVLSFVTRSGQLTNYPTGRNAQYLEYDFP